MSKNLPVPIEQSSLNPTFLHHSGANYTPTSEASAPLAGEGSRWSACAMMIDPFIDPSLSGRVAEASLTFRCRAGSTRFRRDRVREPDCRPRAAAPADRGIQLLVRQAPC